MQEQLRQLGTVLRNQTPAANEALKKLVCGRIVVQEIRQEGRQRHYLRGHFRIDCGSVIEVKTGSSSDLTGTNGESQEAFKDIVINFVEPRLIDEQANRAKALYDQGLMHAEIANELGCVRSYVTKLIKQWYESRGLPAPDGRSRRSQLERKHLSPPLYQEIADEVKKLADDGLTFGNIAERLGVDPVTMRKAWAYWHKSRDLPVPDGRDRRKSLNHDKNRDPESPENSDQESSSP